MPGSGWVLLALLALPSAPRDTAAELAAALRAAASGEPVSLDDLIAGDELAALPVLLEHTRDPNHRLRYRSLSELWRFPRSAAARDACALALQQASAETTRASAECLLALDDTVLRPAADALAAAAGDAALRMDDGPCLAVELLTRLALAGAPAAIDALHEVRARGEHEAEEWEERELLGCVHVALARLCEDASLLQLAGQLERAGTSRERAAALEALARARRPESAPLFLRYVLDPSDPSGSDVRFARVDQAAAFGLGLLLGRDEGEGPADLEPEDIRRIVAEWQGQSDLRSPLPASGKR